MDILKAGSQGEVQDFLPLTIDTRGAYQDDKWDEDLPPAKRSCFREVKEEEDEEGDHTLEVFDPAYYFQSEKKYDPPENIASYVSQNFQRCLNKATRRKLAREHPQPSIPAVTPPLADDVVVDFLGNKFPRKTDDTLRSIQAAVLAGTIPLINLWADMLRSGSLDQEEPTLNAGDVLLAIQKALVLSGNAASYISRIRRDQILMHFDPNLSSILRKLLQTKYKNQSEGDQLFGDSIMSKLASRVDALNSLNKLAQKAKPVSALRNREQGLPQRPRVQPFFRNGPPDRRGVGQGNSSTRKGGTWKPQKLIQETKRKLAQGQKFGHSQKGKNRYFRPPQQDH